MDRPYRGSLEGFESESEPALVHFPKERSRLFHFLPSARERRGEETRRHGHDSEPGQEHKRGEDFAAYGHRIEVPVPDRGQRRDRPPQAMKDRGEAIGLHLVFEIVDADCGEVEEDHRREPEENQLLPDHHKCAVIPLHRSAVSGQFEEPEKPQKSEGSQRPQVDAERQIEGEDGKEVKAAGVMS